LERNVEGFGDLEEPGFGNAHVMNDVESDSIKLKYVVDLNGVEPFKGLKLSFSDGDIVQDDPFEDAEPDDEDYDKYYGRLTHIYRHSVSTPTFRNNGVPEIAFTLPAMDISPEPQTVESSVYTSNANALCLFSKDLDIKIIISMS
jgi:hypothetical protein